MDDFNFGTVNEYLDFGEVFNDIVDQGVNAKKSVNMDYVYLADVDQQKLIAHIIQCNPTLFNNRIEKNLSLEEFGNRYLTLFQVPLKYIGKLTCNDVSVKECLTSKFSTSAFGKLMRKHVTDNNFIYLCGGAYLKFDGLVIIPFIPSYINNLDYYFKANYNNNPYLFLSLKVWVKGLTKDI